MLPSPPPADPLPVAAEWLDQVRAAGRRRNPNAMALATTDGAGRPAVRMVLLKELAAAGYAVFYTNYGSRKAAEMLTTRRAAAVLYWEEIGRQIRFEGAVVASPAAESDAYFASRPLRSQLSAWSSRQSQPLDDPAALERRAEQKALEVGAHAGHAAKRVPRPDFWGGFRLWFDSVELWAEGENRFHERLLYRRELEPSDAHGFRCGPWRWLRLQP
jgi:pyridoxamine 5'-phosphate oxidase